MSDRRYIFMANNPNVPNILKKINYNDNDIFVFFNQFISFRRGTVMNKIIKNKKITKYYFARTRIPTGVHFSGDSKLLKNFNKIFVISDYSKTTVDNIDFLKKHNFKYDLIMIPDIKQLTPYFYEEIKNNKDKYKSTLLPTTGLCTVFFLNNPTIRNSLLVGFTGENFHKCHLGELEQNILNKLTSENHQIKKIDR